MKDFNRCTHIYLIQNVQPNIISLLTLNIFKGLHWVYIDLWSSQKPENTGKQEHYAVRVYGCILSLPGMRRKKESRKLAKIHIHHKYSANMLSIMHSQRDQKVLITRMKNKPEQNTNEGGSSASASERCLPSCSGEQQMLSTARC